MSDVLEPLLASPWVYPVIAALILSDVYLPVLPSGTSLAVATVYAHAAAPRVAALWATAALASALGDALAFRLARRGHSRIHRLLSRNRRISAIDSRVRNMLRRNTIRSVVFARFVPAGRCVATIGCGSDPRIPAGRFHLGSGLAAVTWAGYTVGIGYLNALLFHTAWVSAIVTVVALFVVTSLLARSGSGAAFGR